MDATVQAVQRALIARGYDLGASGADGYAGRMTTAAVAKFQKDIGLAILYPGTIGPKTIGALELDAPASDIVPPWIVLARKKMGLHETRNNAELKAFLKSDAHALGDPAKLPWCGDFIETCIAVTLPNEPMVTNPYWALSWLKFGVEVPKDEPVLGAIGAAERNGGGHVFFVVGHDRTNYHALGGNQDNQVSIVKMPKSRVKGLRFPKTYLVEARQLAFATFTGKFSTNEA